MTQYIATVHKDQDSDYGVQFYDFLGCISAGETILTDQDHQDAIAFLVIEVNVEALRKRAIALVN